jgi:hypothetical protein
VRRASSRWTARVRTIGTTIFIGKAFLVCAGLVTAALGAPAAEPPPPPRVAVLPVHNLSGAPIPSDELLERLRDGLQLNGMGTLSRLETESFLRRHRIRWMGGVGRRMGDLLESGTDADLVLVTSVDTYVDTTLPRVAMTCRLVTTGIEPAIEWMDSAQLAGEAKPGVLGLGLTADVDVLTETVVRELMVSMRRELEGSPPARPPRKGKSRFRPRTRLGSVRVSSVEEDRVPRVAVIPFLNDSLHDEAGEIVALQIVRHLVATDVVEVLEPGLVRDALLEARVIQKDGLSLAQADIVQAMLRADVALTGRVSEYRESAGSIDSPEVGFRLHVLDTESRQVVWSSVSYNRGVDGVWFFDAGRVYTAHGLAFEMTRSAVWQMARPGRRAGR